MEVSVQNARSGQVFPVTVPRDGTVKDVRQRLAAREYVYEREVRLVLGPDRLRPEQRLADLPLGPSGRITMFVVRRQSIDEMLRQTSRFAAE